MTRTGLKGGLIAAAALVFTGTQPASALIVTYFGEDTTANGSFVSGGNAETARNDFLSALSGGVGTQDFEGFTVGTNTPLAISFPGSTGTIGATLQNTGAVQSGPSVGRFATSGSQYWETITGSGGFLLDFDTPISAFGFYGTDIGEFGASLSLRLTDSGGGTTDVDVPNTENGPDAALLFFGFLDVQESYTSIAFLDAGASESFGFDDMTIGDTQQITNPPPESGVIPLPATLPLMLGGFGVAAMALRRRRSR